MSDGENENRDNIVIDNGSGYTKAGLAGEDGPRVVFPSFVGYPKYSIVMIGSEPKEHYVGNMPKPIEEYFN